MGDPRILPPDLPMPPDDGACRHLPQLRTPTVVLPGTAGGTVDLGRATSAWTVLYCLPRANQPDSQPPPDWNWIPGARGCTAQSCDFRDHH
jgi:peroxiredoxin